MHNVMVIHLFLLQPVLIRFYLMGIANYVLALSTDDANFRYRYTNRKGAMFFLRVVIRIGLSKFRRKSH